MNRIALEEHKDNIGYFPGKDLSRKEADVGLKNVFSIFMFHLNF